VSFFGVGYFSGYQELGMVVRSGWCGLVVGLGLWAAGAQVVLDGERARVRLITIVGSIKIWL
jgi:hypothetical protein